MGVPADDDVVQIQRGTNPGEPCVITVNCLDKTGLGCDICWIILDFGLHITKGDFSTDGIWCYIVLWVVPYSASLCTRWSNLKDRLEAICPPCTASFYLIQQPTRPSPVYLLKFCCLDRKGLLHDVTRAFCELELAIQKVKVTTTPDGKVLDLFLITDNMELMHTKNRQDETCKRLQAVLQDSCISCELQLAGPEYEYSQGVSSLPPELTEELLSSELTGDGVCSQALSSDMRNLRKTTVMIDNSMSPAHTLLQIRCADHKGLLYDTVRALKDMNMTILYGRFSPSTMGYCDLDLFIQQKEGKKIVDPEKQSTLCSRLKLECFIPCELSLQTEDQILNYWSPIQLSYLEREDPVFFMMLHLHSKHLESAFFRLKEDGIWHQNVSGRSTDFFWMKTVNFN